jgi:2-phosphosulfolactate phosphatase
MVMTGRQNGSRTVVIDCFPESLPRYRERQAVVAVDVIRATTTAVTAAVGGWRCFPVASIEAAVELAQDLQDPLLVGELGGNTPYGFHLPNSPAQLASRTGAARPIILLSTSGTRVICEASRNEAVYAACLRNYTAQAAILATHHPRVAIVGAGARGEFRMEDQMACAWIAELLVDAGYEPLGETAELVKRWRGATVEVITNGNSAAYLRDTGQSRDLDFVLAHVDDVQAAFRLEGGELVSVPPAVVPIALSGLAGEYLDRST